MIPVETDPEEWARVHLRASSGARMLRRYSDREETIRIGTLVPAHNPDLSCHWLHDGRCEVHAIAPFGCAFFDCSQSKQYADDLSLNGLHAIVKDHDESGLYSRLWTTLWNEGLRSPEISVKRAALDDYYAELQQRKRRRRPPSPLRRPNH